MKCECFGNMTKDEIIIFELKCVCKFNVIELLTEIRNELKKMREAIIDEE
tara:strand:- start:1026 stop:1175 length:150 start_codon:yes stop_codon:yes gene_type:complete